MVLFSHPTGNRNVRELLAGMLRKNLLYEFDTSIAFFPSALTDRLKKISFLSEIQRRIYDTKLQKLTKTDPAMELGRLLAPKLGFSRLTTSEGSYFSIDQVYKSHDRFAASRLSKSLLKGGDVVYCYEDGALNTFKKARELGLSCAYDLPIAYWETSSRLMEEEAQRIPAWAPTLGGGIKSSIEKLERKEEELRLADCVSVPSTFVKDSLPEWAKKKKIILSHFGTPISNSHNRINNRRNDNQKFRVLFVGSMGQRKGLGDLFEAFRLLNRNDVELVVMGSLQAPIEFYRSQHPNFIYEPGRPNAQVLELMGTCDVLCLPSIVEGRALVMQEAMSQGLPLIITKNTGGEDLIIEGKTGFLVPIRSPESIAEKIQWFLDHKNEMNEMRSATISHAKTYTWENYSDKIVDALLNF